MTHLAPHQHSGHPAAHHHDAHAHTHEEGGSPDDAAMAELLDLDAEMLRDHLDELTGWLGDLVDAAPRRITDVGSGTGTGTFALLRRFPAATVTALDVSPHMVQHLHERADRLGLADRVAGVQADLDEDWPESQPADLVWAASSLHHLADPDRALRQSLTALRPGGLLVATEMDHFPRLLPDDIGVGRPGLEGRLHAALGDGPFVDWAEPLAEAGFVLEATRPFAIDLAAPAPEATGRYAQVFLTRLRTHLGGQLDAQDLLALDALLDTEGPHGLWRRGDLRVQTTRTTWVARRP